MSQDDRANLHILEKDTYIINECNDFCAAWDSKLGGKPYLLEDEEYPISNDSHEPLDFLIQINFNDLEDNPYFPKEGLLQFFINIDYSHDEDDIPFLVKYIPNVIYDENKIDFDLDDYYDEDDEYDVIESHRVNFNNMIQEEIKISFEKEIDKANPTAIEWDVYRKENNISKEPSVEELKSMFNEDTFEITRSSKLLGYPDNYDEDIRSYNEKYHDYILLLQLHPNNEYLVKEEEESICWFIHPDDLKQLDFTKIICSFFTN